MINNYYDKKILRKKLTNYLKKKHTKIPSNTKNYWENYITSLVDNTIKNLDSWLTIDIPNEFKSSILNTIEKENWSQILDAFSEQISYGTSSVRGKMISSPKPPFSIINLKNFSQKKFLSKNLQGTSTFNPITLLGFATSIANFARKYNFQKIIIGYDNRFQSKSFAILVSHFFLEKNFKIKIFDDICSTPELAFSVKKLHSDLGIIITASHNDKRFNGLKIMNNLGGPFKKSQNNQIIKEINITKSASSILTQFLNKNMKIINEPKNLQNVKKLNLEIISRNFITDEFLKYLLKFLSPKSENRKNISKLKIGFSATQGTGYHVASKLFSILGIKTQYIKSMILPNSTFNLFQINQNLEPGDKTVYKKTLNEFLKQYDKKQLDKLDAILFTDPDSDRIGVICKVPKNEEKIFGKYKFVTGNELWTIVLWHMLKNLNKKNIKIFDKNNFFVVKSFITSDSIKAISNQFNVKCYDGNVGFPELTNLVQNKWNKNMINLGIFEESNGFTIGGNPNIKSNILSHILEKDGFLGIIKILEVLAYAKSKNLTFLEILNQVYLTPEIGYYHNFRTQLPEKGSFEHTTDNLNKNQILENVKKFTSTSEKYSKSKNQLKICDMPISKVKKFPAVKKLSAVNNIFPFEGIRFYFNSPENHLTIRSSNTESKIRLFVQLKILPGNIPLSNVKANAEKLSQKIVSDFMKNLDAI